VTCLPQPDPHLQRFPELPKIALPAGTKWLTHDLVGDISYSNHSTCLVLDWVNFLHYPFLIKNLQGPLKSHTFTLTFDVSVWASEYYQKSLPFSSNRNIFWNLKISLFLLVSFLLL
jgi:hypothetical protein